MVDFQPYRACATGSVFQRVLVCAEIFFIAQDSQDFAIYTENNLAKIIRVFYQT
ncbi:MAG: hypothetical protein NTW16_03820 [Bacteroidetes bacterium]|nr:hypothetical protein [Bacteroidota bacterium]